MDWRTIIGVLINVGKGVEKKEMCVGSNGVIGGGFGWDVGWVLKG